MPVITIDMWEGRPKETKRKLIQSVSKACMESLGVPPEDVHVVLHEVPRENWGLRGDQASEM